MEGNLLKGSYLLGSEFRPLERIKDGQYQEQIEQSIWQDPAGNAPIVINLTCAVTMSVQFLHSLH